MSLLPPLRFFVNLTFVYRLKTHFKNSQFIIVSLKEGMFNNANVIFRTKFVDGLSTVSRTSNKANVVKMLADAATERDRLKADLQRVTRELVDTSRTLDETRAALGALKRGLVG